MVLYHLICRCTIIGSLPDIYLSIDTLNMVPIVSLQVGRTPIGISIVVLLPDSDIRCASPGIISLSRQLSHRISSGTVGQVTLLECLLICRVLLQS